MKRIASEI